MSSYLSQGEGFDVMKSGDARVALIGFPSVGKVTHTLGPWLLLRGCMVTNVLYVGLTVLHLVEIVIQCPLLAYVCFI